MSDHYYSGRPSSESNQKEMETDLRGVRMKFTTDSGVFSKSSIDFGSRLLIEHLQIMPSHDVLDIGCGYGAIGLTAALMANEGHVWMVDVNERALNLAKANAQQNQIRNVTIVQSDVFSNVTNLSFDVIVTNPPIRAGKQVVHQIFEESVQHLNPGGQLWIVIQKKQGAPSAIKKLEELFVATDIVTKVKGYYIIRATIK
jgi:16S rRNA (guanine1207-N2)-methyltransferase